MRAMRRYFTGGVAWILAVAAAFGAGLGDSVVVIYNKNLPDSRKVAQHYAEKRSVPTSQLFGVDVNANSESMSRAEFRDKLQKPILDWLVAEKLFTLNPQPAPPKPESKYHYITAARIRYLVL